MNITHYRHTGVKPDGTFENGPGAVEVNGGKQYSAPRGGCGSTGCNCSPGHWLSVSLPRTADGVVSGYTVQFDSRAELEAADLGKIEQEASRGAA